MAPRENGTIVIASIRRFGLPAAVAAGWEAGARTAGMFYFPPPSVILARMHEMWFSGPPSRGFLTPEAASDLLPSLTRLGTGWGMAAVAGIALGVVIGSLRVVSALLEPALHFARSIPPSALFPLFMLLFGIGTPLQVALIVFGVIWPILINAMEGVRSIDPGYLDTAAVLRLGLGHRLFRIVLPAALPKILAGLRLSVSLALIMMVVSEMAGSTDGMGYRLREAEGNIDVAAMWSVITLLGVLGIVLNAIFVALEQRHLAWRAHA
ncbi:ABC transporter permease [Nonomuraea maheshkhaliensis]|uniref:ABC transporter permease n=1 Tax=Nonomuraea maheshkhaliensis TaxID=419590 RepID=UPI0031F7C691